MIKRVRRFAAKVLRTFFPKLYGKLQTTAKYWDRHATAASKEYWANIPGVREHIWKRICGSPTTTWYTKKNAERSTPFGRVLCFGDGYGMAAEAFQRKKDIAEIVYLNISSGEGDRFVQRLRDVSYDGRYSIVIADANFFDFLSLGEFDTIIDVGSFHHLERFEHVFPQLNSILKKDGLAYVDEYVGPSKMNFSQAVIDLVNEKLLTFPRELIHSRKRTRKEDFQRILESGSDRSEGIRSGELEDALMNSFRLVSRDMVGGTILHPFFLTACLIPKRLKIKNWYLPQIGIPAIKSLISLEEQMLQQNKLGSDYNLYVFARKE